MIESVNGIFHSSLLAPFSDISHGYSSRKLGDMREPGIREKFLKSLSMSDIPVMADQVHGSDIACVGESDRGKKIAGTDGLVTHEKVAMGIISADCVPLLFADPVTHIFGAAHSGWKGTLGGMATGMVSKMVYMGAQKEEIRAVIGPHICMNCYTIPKGRAEKFNTRFDGDTQIVKKIKGVWHLDIGQANIRLLAEAGVRPDHIDSDFLCTSCHNAVLFSYRKDTEERYGEIMGVIAYV